MHSPIVSIIIPVYNAQNSIVTTIESVLGQTFTEWELLLIDDGSVDTSLQICQEYASLDKRVQVISKPNGGVSSARNIGLSKAKGKWITFADADDELMPGYLENLMQFSDCDLVICGFKIKNGITFQPDIRRIEILKISQEFQNLIENPYYLDTPWCKLFRHDIIKENNIIFNENMKLSEDTLFCYNYLLYVSTIGISNYIGYIYDGKWGGISKYRLNLRELEYMISQFRIILTRIQSKIGYKIDFPNKGYHLAKVENMFSSYKDQDFFKVYCDNYGQISIYQFLGMPKVSPLTWGIKRTINLFKEGKQDEGENLLKEIKSFITVSVFKIKFQSYKQKLFYTLLEITGVRNMSNLLKFYNSVAK